MRTPGHYRLIPTGNYSEIKRCQITRAGQLKEREWLFRGQMWRKSWRSRWARKAMRQVGAAPARLSYQPAGHESMWEPASWRVLHKKKGAGDIIHPVGTWHTGHRKQPGLVWEYGFVLEIQSHTNQHKSIGAYESQHVETHFRTIFFGEKKKRGKWLPFIWISWALLSMEEILVTLSILYSVHFG